MVADFATFISTSYTHQVWLFFYTKQIFILHLKVNLKAKQLQFIIFKDSNIIKIIIIIIEGVACGFNTYFYTTMQKQVGGKGF